MLKSLNGNKKRDGYLPDWRKETNVGEIFFNDTFLIISLYCLSFYLSKININICKKDHIEKCEGNNLDLNIADGDRGAINSATNTNKTDIDRRIDNVNSCINKANTNGRIDLGKGIDKANADKKEDNSGKNIITTDIDKGVMNLGTGINTADQNKRVNNLDIVINTINVK